MTVNQNMSRIVLNVLLADVDNLQRESLAPHIALPTIVQSWRIIYNQLCIVRIALQHLISPISQGIVLAKLSKIAVVKVHILCVKTINCYLSQTIQTFVKVPTRRQAYGISAKSCWRLCKGRQANEYGKNYE